MRRLAPRLLALIGVNVLLIAAVGWRLTFDSTDQPAGDSGAASLDWAKLASAEVRTAVDLSVLTERPLFHSRRQFVALPDPSLAAARPAPPPYEFAGAMLLPGRPATGYLKHAQTGQSLKVGLGDAVEGWTVKAIESRNVTLEFSGELITLGKSATTVAPGIAPVSLSAGTEPVTTNSGVRILSAPGNAAAPVGAGRPPAQNAPDRKPRTYQPPPTS